MKKKTQGYAIGKSNYEINTNSSVNDDIDNTVNISLAIFKEKFLELCEGIIFEKLKDKINHRKNLIYTLKKNVLIYNNLIEENINPCYNITDNSLVFISELKNKFSLLKVCSDRLKSEIKFNNFESEIKLIFQKIIEIMDEIENILTFYPRVLKNFTECDHVNFFEKINFLFKNLASFIQNLVNDNLS